MLHTECGVLGLYNVEEPVRKAYFGLYALQHRGQESAGIFLSDRRKFTGYKNFGMVREVFSTARLQELAAVPGACHAIGHVRYAGQKDNVAANLQPMFFRHLRAEFAICSNGALTNAESLTNALQNEGSIFQSTSISEILTHLLVKNSQKFLPALQEVLPKLVGSYCYVIMRKNKMYAIRDPHGFLPLSVGRIGEGYVIASETSAFDILGAEYLFDVEPGEIIVFSESGLERHRFAPQQKHSICLMEHIYFARPDSTIGGMNIHLSRQRAGQELAKESFVPCDIIVGVPESALSAARGYATECGVPLDSGLIKNKYSGRSFIASTQAERDLIVQMKLSPITSLLKGKRVTLLDDSIVRGTTSRQLIAMVRRAGAREVHLRIASPKMIAPCFYGVDSSSYDALIGAHKSVEEVAEAIGADSLAYLSLEGLCRAVGTKEVCSGCFTKNYPTDLCDHEQWMREHH